MFGKPCPGCGKKISKKYGFCPYCGFNFEKEQDERDYGMLGKDDNFPDFGIKMPFGFDKIFSTLMKQMDKQFQQIDKEMGKEFGQEKMPKIKPSGISISISTSSGESPKIRINGLNPQMKIIEGKPEKPVKIVQPEISNEQMKKLAKLPREEAETTVRRLSSKIIYEISLPGVKSLKDVFINRLENSIEIKAFSQDKIYVKLIPINLPILNYNLEEEKLILEFKTK